MSRLIATFTDKDGKEYGLHADKLAFRIPNGYIKLFGGVSVDINYRLYAKEKEPGIFLEGKLSSKDETNNAVTEVLDEEETSKQMFHKLIEDRQFVEEVPNIKDAMKRIETKFTEQLSDELGLFPMKKQLDAVCLFYNKDNHIIATAERILLGYDDDENKIDFQKCIGQISKNDLHHIDIFWRPGKKVTLELIESLVCESDGDNFLHYLIVGRLKKAEEAELPPQVKTDCRNDEELLENRTSLFGDYSNDDYDNVIDDIDF